MNIYSVTAYRWGHPENHSYIVGMFDTLDKAICEAKSVEINRGGKYLCQVLQHEVNNMAEHAEQRYGKVKCWDDDSKCHYCGHPIEKGSV